MQPDQREGSQTGRRERPRAGLGEAQLRQGALPRPPAPRPHPPAAQARPRRGREGRGVPRAPARVPRQRGRPARDRARGAHPRRRGRRAQGARRAGHEGARAVRRRGPLAGPLQPGAGARRHLAFRARHAALGPPVDRRRRAADGLRLGGAEAEVAAARGQGPHLRLPADRARRRLGPGAPRDRRRADRGRLRPQRPQAVGDQRRVADIVVVMAQVPKSDGHKGGITAFVLDYSPTASRSSTATSSWACAGSRTR